MIFNDPFYPHKCGQCGKTFRTGLVENWTYKIKKYNRERSGAGVAWFDTLWFCSWKCMSKYRKEHEKK